MLVRPPLEYWAQFWSMLYAKVADGLERVQRLATKMIKDWEAKGRLRGLGLFGLEKRRLGGTLSPCFSI